MNFLRKTIDSRRIQRYHNFKFELNYVYILFKVFFINFKPRKSNSLLAAGRFPYRITLIMMKDIWGGIFNIDANPS